MNLSAPVCPPCVLVISVVLLTAVFRHTMSRRLLTMYLSVWYVSLRGSAVLVGLNSLLLVRASFRELVSTTL